MLAHHYRMPMQLYLVPIILAYFAKIAVAHLDSWLRLASCRYANAEENMELGTTAKLQAWLRPQCHSPSERFQGALSLGVALV